MSKSVSELVCRQHLLLTCTTNEILQTTTLSILSLYIDTT